MDELDKFCRSWYAPHQSFFLLIFTDWMDSHASQTGESQLIPEELINTDGEVLAPVWVNDKESGTPYFRKYK